MRPQQCHDRLRGPTQIVLNLTNRCNLRCRYCFNDSRNGFNTELSDTELLELVRHLSSTVRPHNVCFSGGEPLLRSDILQRCIGTLTEAGIRTNLLTNGVLLTPRLIHALAGLGLKEIEVSLDGPDRDTHGDTRGASSFRPVMGALEALRACCFPSYGASLVLTRRNHALLDEVISLLASRRTQVLALRPLLPVGRATACSDLQMTPQQSRRVARTLRRHAGGNGPPRIIFPDPLGHAFSFGAGAPAFGMEIRANGDLVLSPYLPVALGNIRRHSVSEYWSAGWPRTWRRPPIRRLVSLLKVGDWDGLHKAINEAQDADIIATAQ